MSLLSRLCNWILGKALCAAVKDSTDLRTCINIATSHGTEKIVSSLREQNLAESTINTCANMYTLGAQRAACIAAAVMDNNTEAADRLISGVDDLLADLERIVENGSQEQSDLALRLLRDYESKFDALMVRLDG